MRSSVFILILLRIPLPPQELGQSLNPSQRFRAYTSPNISYSEGERRVGRAQTFDSI